jgi:dienelactone hydrolase
MMRRWTIAFVLIAAAASAAPRVEDFGDLPAISGVHISPDGKHLATVEPVDGRPVILVYDIDPKPGAKPVGFDEPGGIPVGVYWANNDRLICLYNAVVVQNTNQGLYMRNNARAISVSISGKDPAILLKSLLAFKINGSTISVDGRDPDGQHVYLAAYDLNGNISLFRADVDDERGTIADGGDPDTGDWVMGKNGVAVAQLDYVSPPGDTKAFPTEHVILLDKDGGREIGAFETQGRGAVDVAGVTQDGSALLFSRYGDQDTRVVDAFPLAGKTFGKTMFSDPAYDVGDFVHDEWTGAITGVMYQAVKNEYRYFDPDLARIQHGLEKALPEQTVEIASYDEKRENMVVGSSDPQHPRTYWLYNTQTHQLKALASEYPNLQPADLGISEPYDYKSSDGLDIHGYLTLPPGKDPHNLPVVIFPHGGPEARDSLGFDWWAQFMASRGYAVLQPNFRGSSGYGWKFQAAGFGQWGRKMQDDLSDGVKKLIADGIADPKRICIVGASYGGYAALAGATFTPDLYACAVSVAGVSNIANLIGSSGNADFWRSRIGDISTQEGAMNDASPALHAGNVRAPILLIHCSRDVTVPIGQSNLEQIALKKAGKSVDFITIDGDDHYLNLASTRIRVLQEIEKFLNANIGH